MKYASLYLFPMVNYLVRFNKHYRLNYMKNYLFLFFISINLVVFGQNHIEMDRMINSATKLGAFPSVCIDNITIANRSIIKSLNIPKRYILKIKLSDSLVTIKTKLPYLLNGKILIEDRKTLKLIKGQYINKLEYLSSRETRNILNINIKKGVILVCTIQQVL